MLGKDLVRALSLLLWASTSGCVDGPTAPNNAAFEIIYRSAFGNSWVFAVMSADGTNRRRLATPSDNFYCPSLSPDGQQLLYATVSGNQIAIYDLRTNTETQLTSDTQWSQCPTWSPDGTQIAFFRGPSTAPEGFGLYLMSADGSNVRALTETGYVWSGIDWSPDGRWLAVTRLDFQLVLVDPLTGTVGSVLTPGSTGYEPAFSPDGAEVAFTSERAGPPDLYVIRMDGTNLRRLTTSPGFPEGSHGAQWSPDGRQLVFWRRLAQLPLPFATIVLRMSSSGSEFPWGDDVLILGDQPFWRLLE